MKKLKIPTGRRLSWHPLDEVPAQPEMQLSVAGWAFILGIILFSGSLYILSVTGIKLLGMITPIGGVLFIIGWVILLLKVRS